MCEKKVGVLVDPDRPHEPWTLADGRGYCPRCRRSSRSGKKWASVRFFKGVCNLGRERESGFAARSAAVACTRRHLNGMKQGGLWETEVVPEWDHLVTLQVQGGRQYTRHHRPGPDGEYVLGEAIV